MRNRTRQLAYVAVLGLIVAALALVTDSVAQPGRRRGPMRPRVTKAIAVIHPVGDSGVKGTVVFTQVQGGVEVTAEISGLKPGEHGFHVHEFGDCSAPDGTSAGGHFNPTGAPHGGPDDAQRHVGDLGNIKADESGNATYKRVDKMVALNGPHSVVGRGIIIHAGRDDLKSQPSGDAGARVACGVIGIAKPSAETTQ